MNNYIFLNIDGVLTNNCNHFSFNKKSFEALKEIIDECDKKTKVILFSPWAYTLASYYGIANELSEYGIELSDKVKYSKGSHSEELMTYLRDNNVEQYVVLDNQTMGFEDIMDHLVKIDIFTGLTSNYKEEILKKLTQKTPED